MKCSELKRFFLGFFCLSKYVSSLVFQFRYAVVAFSLRHYTFSGSVFIVPIFGGYLSDAFAGKYNTIFGSGLIYIIGKLYSTVVINNVFIIYFLMSFMLRMVDSLI
jgi:dipeptide/tripeptide permease